MHKGGKLSIADNKSLTDLIVWKSIKSFISGGGSVEYKTTISKKGIEQGFEGQIYVPAARFDSFGISPYNIVRTLVNQVPALIEATVFISSDDVEMLRLKNGKQVKITTGDTIVSETADGDVFGVDENGRTVVYEYPNGNRRA